MCWIIIYRMSTTSFRLVPKYVTLNDPEPRISGLSAFFRAFSSELYLALQLDTTVSHILSISSAFLIVQHVKNPETTLRRWNNVIHNFILVFISHVRAYEMNMILFRFYFSFIWSCASRFSLSHTTRAKKFQVQCE